MAKKMKLCKLLPLQQILKERQNPQPNNYNKRETTLLSFKGLQKNI